MTHEAGIPEVGDIARDWWSDLAGGGTGRPRDRASLAELRRSTDPIDIAFVPAFSNLRRRLHAVSDVRLRRTAMIAHILAYVRDNDPRPFARALGPVKDNEGAPMSQARFRRLLQACDDEDLVRQLVRAVKMLKGKANVADLARAIWFWNDRTRRDWAFHYLDAEPPAAGSDTT